MEIYEVGGAVRDRLLGLPIKDRDFVVVGATPAEMLARGFKPVGKDFPVFLHPDSREEYALARTERKTAPGYKGFVFHADADVTLQDDLARRDLTINAMAIAADGRLIDPFGGRQDIERRLLRHVGPAFAEDPVRILRLARFAARFEGFDIAGETLALCRRMVDAGEVDALVAERVWQELSRGMLTAAPVHMFEVLARCGALHKLLPELAPCLSQEPPFPALQRVAPDDPLPLRWACLWLPPLDGAADKALAVAERLRVPSDCRELSVLAAREAAGVAGAGAWDAEATLALIERCDGLRRPQRFAALLRVARLFGGEAAEAAVGRLQRALAAARQVDAGALAKQVSERGQIPQRVRRARLAAVQAALRP